MFQFDSDFTMTIGGASIGAPRLPVVNPATGRVFAQAPDCTPEQLDLAVAAARKAFPAWSARAFEDRRAIVVSLFDILASNADGLHRLLTREQGKPHDVAMGEIMGAAHWCQAVATLRLPTEVIEDTPERLSWVRRVPIGVVGAIAPWNFPVLLAFFKLAPALLAGNTVVLKPSPLTPLTTLKIGELLRGVLPEGVLNVVSGTDALGPLLSSHPGIDKISFTGSTQTGRKVMAGAADSLKRLTLELGGNDPAIVLPDVDVPAVAEKLFWSAFMNSGQICVATKRLYVHEDIYEPLKAAMIAYAATIKIGDGAEQGTQIGPIQNRQQFERVQKLVADAKAEGCEVLGVGKVPDMGGYFMPISFVDNPPENSRIVQEEQFGPILPLMKFKQVDDAVARANATEFGLGASVWSGDAKAAQAIAERLLAGTVWINESLYMSPLAPFAGHKQSGIGVEGGLEGLLEYTLPQHIVLSRAAS